MVAVWKRWLSPGNRLRDIENPGFNELVTSWYADHDYKHYPNAIECFLLIAFLAYDCRSASKKRGESAAAATTRRTLPTWSTRSYERNSCKPVIGGIQVRLRAEVGEASDGVRAAGRRVLVNLVFMTNRRERCYFSTRTTLLMRVEIVSSASGAPIVTREGCAAMLRFVS